LHFVSFCQVAIRDSRTIIDVLVNVVQTAEEPTTIVHYLRDAQVLQEAMRLPSGLRCFKSLKPRAAKR